jgi:hypothetical protein
MKPVLRCLIAAFVFTAAAVAETAAKKFPLLGEVFSVAVLLTISLENPKP